MHVAGSGTSKYYMYLSKNLAKDSFNGGDKEMFDHFLAFIRPPMEGEDEPKWIFIDIEQTTEFTEEMFLEAVKGKDNFMSQADALKHIKDTLKIDCIVPHLYCFNSGTYCRVAFDMLDIPYLGSPGSMNHIYASKWMSQSLVKGYGVRCPQDQLLKENDLSQVQQKVPLIVKPSKEDNSNGVSLVKKSEDIQAALDEAFKWDDEILVQEYIPGREIRVGVSKRDGEIEVHALLEYLFNEKTEIRDKNAKYCHDEEGMAMHFNIPAKSDTALKISCPAATSDALK